MCLQRRISRAFFVASALSWLMCPAAKPQASTPAAKRLKIYISVDMEGVAGVVTADQLGPSGFEYERFRHFMTNETLAAVYAGNQSGATEIVVSDSHGNGESLLFEEFPKNVRIVRSWPRHGGMMAGLDSTFDAALFIGYHASTTNMHLRIVQQVDSHTIRFMGKDMAEVSDFVDVVDGYSPDLAP